METVFAKDRAEWRRWLAKNGTRIEEIWVVFYKKATGKTGVSYDHAVEEALCFGWIDGLKKSLDEECYAFRFTPRKPKSQWSPSNLARMERLIKEGKMTPAGLKLYRSDERRDVAPMPTEMPGGLADRFRKQRRAWSNYEKFPPGYRRLTAGWVASAKKEETRLKRLNKLIEFSARNERMEFT
jgi:uncharacterized protein YdeI (YjbR/CyaY-like superfamily)